MLIVLSRAVDDRSATSIAIAQTNIKRMLAYSTIANMGFMLLGFLAANLNGYSAAMFYMVAYVLTSLASFGIVLLLSREGFEADQLDDFKGLNQRSPWWAFIMLLVMFSLAGMPPTIGFYAKFAGDRGGGQRRLRLARRGRACWRRWSARSTTCASSS